MDIYLVGIVFCLSLQINGLTDFCKIKCNNLEHTACIYKTRSGSCQGFINKEIEQKDKDSIVNKHNELRRKIAEGQQPTDDSKLQPNASNMMEMVWDDELAYVAKVWAFQCLFEHDKCRDVEDFQVGQNIAYEGQSQGPPQMDLGIFVERWFSEVKDFDSNLVNSFQHRGGPMIGHYTQVVWAKSQYVGCGQSFYTENGFHNLLLVCNYGPGGNFLGDKIYEEGEACAGCASDTPCKDKLCQNKGPRKWDGVENGFDFGGGMSIRKTFSVPFPIYVTFFILLQIK